METLTPQERVRRALRREPVDRLPVQTNFTGAMGVKLAAHFGCPVTDLAARLDNHLLRVDVSHPPRLSADGKVSFDWWGAGWGTETEGYWHAHAPLAGSTDLEKFAWPDPEADGLLADAQRALAADAGRHFAVPNFGFALFERAWSLRGFDQLLMDLVDQPEWVEELLDRITHIQVTLATRFIALGRENEEASGTNTASSPLATNRKGRMEKAEGRISAPTPNPVPSRFRGSMREVSVRGILPTAPHGAAQGGRSEGCVNGGYFGDDYGAQRSLLFSPALWRRLMKPRLARMFAVFRQAGLPVILHSDGDIWPILPDLVEIGLTCLNPVQPEVLDHARLQREFGSQLSFYGGISTQGVLPGGTPAEVREATLACLRHLAPDGTGLILGPSHRLQSDVPAENVAALLQTAHTNA